MGRDDLGQRGAAKFLFAVSVLVLAVAQLSHGAAAPGTFVETRHVYERGERCELHVIAGDADAVDFDISGWLAASAKPAEGQVQYTIDTALLRVGDYMVRARLMKGGQLLTNSTFALAVAPPHDAERMPVWRWGGGSNFEWWAERGFTGAFTASRRDPLVPGGSMAAQYERIFDKATRLDYELGFYFHSLISATLQKNEDVLCLNPDGTRDKKVYPYAPAVVEHALATKDSWMSHFSEYPSLRHVMLCSEYHTPFCVNDMVVKMAQEEIGLDARDFIVETGKIKGPATVRDGIIEDDNARYRFLQWWWQRGHGTAPLNEAAGKVVKKHRPDAITWHEPYRLAPVRNSHKGLDCIGSWTYGNPDIKRLCYTTYLQAAARPNGQLVHQDITLFVYGRFALPLGESTADLSKDYAGKDPYFTAGPDYAREAMWIVLSQRPDILCFYSAGKLSPDKAAQDPHFSSPETYDAIGQTCDVLVKPYGPAILQSTRAKPRVALLMSAASTWFRASPWFSGYETEKTLPFASLLMMNHVPFDVLLDEDILEGALDRYDVLVMPKADTLLRSMHERIAAFAKGKGTVIADSSLRATIPGAVITEYDFSYQNRRDGRALSKGNGVTAEEGRAIMEGYAAELAPLLAKVPRPATASSPRVLTNTLEGGAAKYHFFVNDDRTYGPRFGKWKLRFELGVRQMAQGSVSAPESAVLYDCLRRRPIESAWKDGRAAFDLVLPGAWGALVAVVPEAIKQVTVEAPESLEAGTPVAITVRVTGESGAPIDGVLPLQISVLDPLGRKTEWSRFTATKGGVAEFSFTPAINAPKGTWSVGVTDLIAGTTTTVEIAG
jgi:hypothetical protein